MGDVGQSRVHPGHPLTQYCDCRLEDDCRTLTVISMMILLVTRMLIDPRWLSTRCHQSVHVLSPFILGALPVPMLRQVYAGVQKW